MGAGEDRGGNRPSREALDHLTETVPAIVYIAEMGAHGRWRYISPQVTEILGYEPEEWCSDDTLWYRSIHPDDVAEVMIEEDRNPTATEIVPPVEYRLRARDGRWVWIYECARLVVDSESGQPLWHGVISDISALKEAEGTAARRAEQQAFTARLGAELLTVSDQQEMFELIVSMMIDLEDIVEAEAWKYLDGDQMILRHRSGGEVPDLTLPLEVDRYPGNELRSGDTVVVIEWQTDERMKRYIEHLNPKVASTILVPIGGIRSQFGFLAINASVPNRFSAQDQDFLLAATSLLGSTIDRDQVEQSLRHRLQHDSLTELPNRDLFTATLRQAMERSLSEEDPMAVLFLDIDHFKLINDGIGHHVGDETLREVGRRLGLSLPDGDTVARFGGDEFGLVVGSVPDSETAIRIAESLLESLVDPIHFEGIEVVVAASIGIAFFDPTRDPDKSADFLVREANAAMHEAKNLGRAQVRLFDQTLRNTSANRLDIESGLRAAIDREQLVLFYQPVVSLPERRIVGFEALVRWQHPERGLIEPADFVPVAEESGLISLIDSWAMREAARQLEEWKPITPADGQMVVAVNASARQLNRVALPAEIAALLQRHSLSPRSLGIEITEGTLISGPGTVRDVLDRIHELGVRLGLDDFGTGFSSLSHIGQFPFDAIKIDRSFIQQLGSGDLAGPAITDAVLRIGEALSTVVIAEGVSTHAELDLVTRIGCRVVQGYAISKPVNAATATTMLAARVIPAPDAL